MSINSDAFTMRDRMRLAMQGAAAVKIATAMASNVARMTRKNIKVMVIPHGYDIQVVSPPVDSAAHAL